MTRSTSIRHMERAARALAMLLLAFAWTDGSAADFVAPSGDGWHRWQVETSTNGRNFCCYQWHKGTVGKQGCDLDGRDGLSISTDDCDISGSEMRIYVQIENGDVRQIRALNSRCPVTAREAVTDLGDVDTDASIAWLLSQLDQTSSRDEDALAAISAHSEDAAFQALSSLIENRSLRSKTREQALFWLAQIDSDQVFAYLDSLLSRT